MKLPRYECKRCGYKWIPRSDKKPIACASPECRSPYWDKERKSMKEKMDDVIESNADCPVHSGSSEG